MPGYNVSVAGKKSYNEFLCISCNFLLKDAVQLEDGRRICLSCYDENKFGKEPDERKQEYMEDDNGGPLSIGTATAREKGYFPDRFARRMVADIKVYCHFKSIGCPWIGPVKEFEKHIEMCDMKPIKCRKCSQDVAAAMLQQHLAETCQGRLVICTFCGEKLTPVSLESHFKICKKRPVTCDQCDMTLQPGQELMDHQQVWCKESQGLCPFNDEGCKHDQVMDKKGLFQHVKENLIFHIMLLLSHIKIITRSLGDVKGKLYAMKDDVYFQLESLQTLIRDIQSKVVRWTDYLKGELQNQRSVIEDTNKKALECEKTLQEVMINKEQYETELLEIKEKTFVHESQIQEQLPAIGEMQKQLNVMADRVEALRNAVYEIRVTQQKILGQAPKANLQAMVYPASDSPDYLVAYNGELTWKISDVTRWRQEAILNRTRSFFSPPFFTSVSGFKCCGRIYMNGDGPAKGTHISLFFVVMKGPFDALQKWPLNKKITLMLLNQDGDNHHEESFKPDLSSSSFQRPTKETNIASGSPFFFSLNALENNGFLKDDTIFIRIKVDV